MEQENIRNHLLDQLIGIPKLLNSPQIKILDEDDYPHPSAIQWRRQDSQLRSGRCGTARETAH